MRRLCLFAMLAACSSAEPAVVHEPDAARRSDDPVALAPGSYAIAWTCEDGCAPLLFPPSSFNRLDVNEAFALSWSTDDVEGGQVTVGTVDGDCVETTGLTFGESGATGAATFCPETAGAEATMVYTASFGPARERTYIVKALP